MGAIIRMNTRQLMRDFLPNIEKQEDFQFVIISETVKTDKRLKNIETIKRLVPPQQLLRKFMEGDEKSYREMYAAYLSHPNIEGFLTVIAKAAVTENMNVVLLCSEYEDNWGYLKAICDYMEAVYETKTHSVKSYLKNPAKASEFKNKKVLESIITEKLTELEKANVDLSTEEEDPSIKMRAKVLEKLKDEDYDKKELRKLGKKMGLKLDKDLSRKKMMKQIADYKVKKELKKAKKKKKG